MTETFKNNLQSNNEVKDRKGENENTNSIEKLIEDRLRNFENKLDQVMTSKFSHICQSLQEKMKETIVTQTIVGIPEKMNETFKNALTKNLPSTAIPNFKQVMSDERNNKLIQDKEKNEGLQISLFTE